MAEPDEIQENAAADFTYTITDEDDVALDVSTATTITLYFGGPSSASVTLTGSFVTDGSDGQVTGLMPVDTLTPDGQWKWQPYVDGAGFHSGRAKVRRFVVRPNV